MSRGVDTDRRLSVLVVDDDAVTRVAVEDRLDEAGFDVVEACDGEAGLAAFNGRPADIVLLDVMMPRLDGFAVCERLRASPAGEHVPVLMMTGNDDVESVSRAFKAGATDFISKPLNLDLLVHRLRYMLRAKHTADLLRQRESSLDYAQRIARLGNWERDSVTDSFSCSDALIELLGLGDGKPTWTQFLGRIRPADRERVVEEMARCARSGHSCELEFGMIRPDGREMMVRQDTEVVKKESASAPRMVGAIQDITQMRLAEARIRELAYSDAVTGLPNRAMLNEYLNRAVDEARRHADVLAVMFVDLDHFKRINDTWGHSTGDDVLRGVAKRLTGCLRSDDFATRVPFADGAPAGGRGAVARLGGDEFVVLLPQFRRAEDAAGVAERINQELSRPFEVHSTEVYVSSSIGISVFPDDGNDAATLLTRADAAMYEAKARGRNGYRFYTREMQGRAFVRLSVEAGLRRGLERGEFELHYQPRIDLRTGAVAGVEALLRWNNPGMGMVSPGEFIPVAEECGLIVPLGRWVLEQACAQAQAWRCAGWPDLGVSVNLSVVQTRSGALVDTVRGALELSALPAGMLELELTEGLLMSDTEATIRLMSRLKSMGVRLAIDDFGTGYSSLQYLKRLPLDALKIDRCFIGEMDRDRDDAAIVRGTIGLAHSLRLRVVAEGVENARQLELLCELGCDESQGYFHSRPLSVADLEAWLREHRPRAAQCVA